MTAADDTIRLGRFLDVEGVRLRDLEAVRDGTAGTSVLLRERLLEARLAPMTGLDTPWCAFALGALSERLSISGFTVDGTERPDLMTRWRAGVPGSLEAMMWLSVLTFGRGYVLSWADDDGRPFISMESPFEVVHEVDRRTGETVLALKRWVTAEGEARAILFRPDRIEHLTAAGHVPVELYAPAGPHPPPVAVSAWTTTRTDPNPLGRVPVSPIVLRRSVADTVGRSDVEPLRGVAAAISKTVLDLLVISEHFAAPRRFATGIEVPIDPETGLPVNPFESASGSTPRVMVAEQTEASFGQFPAADMSGILALHERLVADLLARASVPQHQGLGGSKGQQLSAESVRSAEAGLLSKVAQRQAALGDGVARAVRLSSEIATGRAEGYVTTKWAPAGTQSTAADADAVTKLIGAGLDPVGVAQLVLGLSVEQAETLRPRSPIETP